MAVTVDIQANPNRDTVGKTEADTTIIYSGVTGLVVYEICRIDTNETFTIKSDADISNMANVTKLDDGELHVILPFRTNFKARSRTYSAGGTWSDWAFFKTRDKRYQTPDAISQLSDDLITASAGKGNKTITVTNDAKASVVATAAGATVTNDDTGYCDTTEITYTAKGATVRNTTKITYTDRGATVDNT